MTARDAILTTSPGKLPFHGRGALRLAWCAPIACADTCRHAESVDHAAIRRTIGEASEGYLPPEAVARLLDAAGIPRAQEVFTSHESEIEKACATCGFPLS
jgi:hypothetical protein